jgi:hypothetical protein
MYSHEIGKEVIVLNVYGPYADRFPFWERFSNSIFLGHSHTIVRGDLNLFLGNFDMVKLL